MTENELKGLSYLYENVLPKLQEIIRDMALNKHFCVEISTGNYKYGMKCIIIVSKDVEKMCNESLLCVKTFRFSTFMFRGNAELYEKELRGINHFISNWMERLSA